MTPMEATSAWEYGSCGWDLARNIREYRYRPEGL